MIMEQFFTDRKTIQRLMNGPIGPFIGLFARQLSEQGFSRRSGRAQIRVVGNFSQWLTMNSVTAQEISSEHVEAYVQERCSKQCLDSSDCRALMRILNLLRQEGATTVQSRVINLRSAERLLKRFGAYLDEERALASASITSYKGVVTAFLAHRFADTECDLSTLSAADVIAFVHHEAERLSRKGAKNVTTGLRSFLRFARYQGLINIDLEAAVPTVANWAMATIPKSLCIERVKRVLSHCDRQTATGRRDYAILLILTRLGLRAGEVIHLALEDIDWYAGCITVTGKGHCSQLPLPTDVGEAIADYLQHGRPRSSSRAVFLRNCAPATGFDGPDAVSAIVRRALAGAGIDAPRKGAHQFRHTLATEMLRQGASLAEIGELLRHRSVQATTIYAKVDLISLRSLAMVWPGGAL
jgi:site-specific recombinase XerD